ncbi:MAG: type I restriction endonuclease subunit R [Lachnospiraceae bacterium]|nr:type I restriction endonuclease subunit R [Lachnospiraceae bacterium]
MKENEFENELIQYLSGKRMTGGKSGRVRETGSYLVKTKLWKYEPKIKTTEALWENFKQILEQHNQSTLQHPLSVVEFNQVKKIISDLHTPYEAGQFLYGLNGVSQIEVDLDDGRHVFLTVFDQREIGAGDTVYQVVNQIKRSAVIAGKPERRFDTTLLINGLPVIQIEEKTGTHDVNEALNQMHQYIDENQYRDIFSTVQILVAMTPNNVKYMANTTAEQFNKEFAFHWQRKEDNSIVRSWKEFADAMLSIPMAHQMAVNYMILDGTKNRETLKVMRPYQVHATQKVIEAVKHADFESGKKKIGYIWHTTGSGKTITSFKTAWLASRLPNVDKVVFVVDRIALTRQTNERYQAYDPDGDTGEHLSAGGVWETKSTADLSRKLRSRDNKIIVTSVQKLGMLVKRKNFKSPEKNIVFIVDEAHRSTRGEYFAAIQKAFKRSLWVGYTGTPMFDETATGLATEEVFGRLLHAYTIREAIADKNVLGFKVDFETTIDEEKMRLQYLPGFYKMRHPKWSEAQIETKIRHLTAEDMDDTIEPSFYDENEEHIRLVVEDVFKNWKNRSNDGKYNALFTTHVGGGRASIPMAMMYYREFQRVNAENREKGKTVLKVAVTFSPDTSNHDTQLETNRSLSEAIVQYNREFDTTFEVKDVAGYTEDVRSRLDRTAKDGKYLDLVIVVEQLLTGFDAPELNTLYVDRTLKGANLIQAYSRTNRISDRQEKPWGRIVNYRWPAQNEKLMNAALAIYANRDSANLSEETKKQLNEEAGIIAKPFLPIFEEVRKIVDELKNMTNGFQKIPESEKQKEQMLELLRQYSVGMAKLKQYDPECVNGEKIGFDYEEPDDLIKALGMEPDEEIMLTSVLSNELKQELAKERNVPVFQIELKMTHVKDIQVDYDYLTELVEELLNQVHEEDEEGICKTKEKIRQFAGGLEDRQYAFRIMNAAEAIINGLYPADPNFKYPARLERGSGKVIEEANNVSLDRCFQEFRIKWGIIDIISSAEMRALFERHRYGQRDLDDTGRIQDIIAKGSQSYTVLSHDRQVQALSRIKYRNGLRDAIYQLADELVKH